MYSFIFRIWTVALFSNTYIGFFVVGLAVDCLIVGLAVGRFDEDLVEGFDGASVGVVVMSGVPDSRQL